MTHPQNTQISFEDILQFWFEELTPQQWWQKNNDVDRDLKNRFEAIHNSATFGELYHWRETARGRLAEIIVLDQFSRNIHRDHPLSFAFDGMALLLSQEMIRLNLDQDLNVVERSFCYMPFMHSESKIIHQQALTLFEKNNIDSNIQFEKAHKDIIDRFGRYPHRNTLLNRASTQEELEFLKTHTGF